MRTIGAGRPHRVRGREMGHQGESGRIGKVLEDAQGFEDVGLWGDDEWGCSRWKHAS